MLYATPALVAPTLIAVVLISVVSLRLKAVVAALLLTTANSTVPALSIANTVSRAATLLEVPSVAVNGTTTDTAAGTVRVLTVPLDKVLLRKSKAVGLSVKVRAFVATEAVMG